MTPPYDEHIDKLKFEGSLTALDSHSQGMSKVIFTW